MQRKLLSSQQAVIRTERLRWRGLSRRTHGKSADLVAQSLH